MTSACFHCGEMLPARPVNVDLDGARRAMCCGGCAAAAAWIRDAGLGDYYRLRTADGQKADEVPLDFSAWDRADLLAEHSRKVGDRREITVLVEGIRCAACAWLIGRALSDMRGVIEAEPNAVTGRLHLCWDPDATPLSRILDRLAHLGYRPHLATGEEAEKARSAERRDMIKRLAVAGIGSLQAMMFAEALYLDFHSTMPEATRDFFRWLTFLVSTPVVFYAGWPFLAGMANELRLRRFGMDTLIATSVLIAYFASLVETLRGGPHVWFDAAVMFVLFLLVARFLERMARRKAQSAVDHLARARPALAWQERDDGSLMQVPLHTLAQGDRVFVRAGETVPADGVLLDTADLDEALLTGESRPVQRGPGEPVHAGSMAVGRPLRLEVRRTGQDTLLSHLVRLVERAQAGRPHMAHLADAVASRFVVALFAIAAVVAVVWIQVQPERAFEVTLAVLIVSCPCALSLAIPAALAAAHARLSAMGVLVLRPDALETLARVDTVLLDKTGTLTQGRMRLLEVSLAHHVAPVGAHPWATTGSHARDAHVAFGWAPTTAVALRIAAALERGSQHPIAAAFARDDAPQASDVQVIPGLGIEGVVEGQRWRLGHGAFVGVDNDADDAIHLALVSDTSCRSGDSRDPEFERDEAPIAAVAAPTQGMVASRVVPGAPQTVRGEEGGARPQAEASPTVRGEELSRPAKPDRDSVSNHSSHPGYPSPTLHPIARFRIGDTPRSDAGRAITTLRARGLELEVLSGDAASPVTDLCRSLGIDRFRARQRPQDKLARVRALQGRGHVVAMLGDGINDAPVLAGADVSIAMAGGAPLAHRAADVVLMGESLGRVPDTLSLARDTRRLVRQNLAWALGYNLIALPFAALGFVTPWMAAIGMAASSLIVTLNALRLARAPRRRTPVPTTLTREATA
ncbi:MAG TPA: heavy metal translocating P-type ATPase metal-binding domain-containing protein [Xanthomonadaceae bacterium]|nr:heavy metal translocating P-type ATPase metal-binding domain-containing protein [Xanthomonadaceae bacterium]